MRLDDTVAKFFSTFLPTKIMTHQLFKSTYFNKILIIKKLKHYAILI